MSYISADDVLHQEFIETIQQCVRGKSIFILCKEKKLANEYSLSVKSIQRIIRTVKQMDGLSS